MLRTLFARPLIRTDRLCIHRLQTGDWTDIARLDADFRRSPYRAYDTFYTRNIFRLRSQIRRISQQHPFFTVYLPRSSRMVGYVCFRQTGTTFDMGYRFHSSHHHHGYALESCRAIMDYLRANRDISAFTAGTALANAPSVRLLEALGFELTDTEMLAFHRDAEGKPICFEGGNFILPLR